jgi:hypothetical protein
MLRMWEMINAYRIFVEKPLEKCSLRKGGYERITLRWYKVKLYLCLTKHHAMKTYWGSGDIAPHILDLGIRWR